MITLTLNIIKEIIGKNMNITVPSNLGLVLASAMPTEAGSLEYYGKSIQLADCDTADDWSVVSGAGVTITADNQDYREGSGSIKFFIPAGVDGIIKYTLPIAQVCTGYQATKIWAKTDYYSTDTPALMAQLALQVSANNSTWSTGAFTLSTIATAWEEHDYVLSSLESAFYNSVAYVKFEISNTSASDITIWIDDVRAISYVSLQGVSHSGKVFQAWPKIKTGTYNGDGTTPRNIYVGRAESPNVIVVQGIGATYYQTMWRMSIMAANDSLELGSSSAFATDCILGEGHDGGNYQGYFTVGDNRKVNRNGDVYWYMCLWTD